MALTINFDTKVIEIPQADLTFISGSLYELDTNQFRKDVMAILDDETHIWMPNAFTHNTEVTVAGVTFARTLEFINGYSIEFEDGAYSVRLVGSNNNIFDVENGILAQNTVQVIAQNSAGLVSNESSTDIATALFSTEIESSGGLDMQQILQVLLAVCAGRTTNGGAVFKTPNGDSVRVTATVNNDNERTNIDLDFS